MISKMVQFTTGEQVPSFKLDSEVFGMSDISVRMVVLYMVDQ